MTARYTGVLSWWSDEQNNGFGYIEPDGKEGPCVVFRDEMLRARIAPVVGVRVSFEIGITRGDITGAVRVELADRPAPVSAEPVLASRPDSPAQAETKAAARGKPR